MIVPSLWLSLEEVAKAILASTPDNLPVEREHKPLHSVVRFIQWVKFTDDGAFSQGFAGTKHTEMRKSMRSCPSGRRMIALQRYMKK